MRAPYVPRFAMVVWPDALDQTLPSCIYLDGVDDAVKRGALLIGREDAEMFGVPVRDRDPGDEDTSC
jgi:hypothetical protein